MAYKYFVFMPCQGPWYFNLIPLSLGPPLIQEVSFHIGKQVGHELYSQCLFWLRCRLCCSLLMSVIMCLRGHWSSVCRPVTASIDLGYSEQRHPISILGGKSQGLLCTSGTFIVQFQEFQSPPMNHTSNCLWAW